MSDLYSSGQKIDLAKSIITEFSGGKTSLGYSSPMFTKIRKMEQKYNKNNGYCDLNDFCIRLSEIPVKHFRLMLVIGWLDHDTEEPFPYLNGFYKSAYHGKQGFTQVEHFMTVESYIKLLFIELETAEIHKHDQTR
jgi:hypothetical protein